MKKIKGNWSVILFLGKQIGFEKKERRRRKPGRKKKKKRRFWGKKGKEKRFDRFLLTINEITETDLKLYSI